MKLSQMTLFNIFRFRFIYSIKQNKSYICSIINDLFLSWDHLHYIIFILQLNNLSIDLSDANSLDVTSVP